MIGRSGERGSGISVLAARHDDDDIIEYSRHIEMQFKNKGFENIVMIRQMYSNESHQELIFRSIYNAIMD